MRKTKAFVLILALAALAAAAAAQGPAKTTVADTLYDPAGGLATGSITVTAPMSFTSADGYVVYHGAVATGAIAGGQFSLALVPNAGSTPSGSYYRVLVRTGAGSYSEIWIVPSSGTPVRLSAVRALLPPTPSFVFAFSQINPPGGCASNEFIEWSGTSWMCNTSAGGMANPMTSVGDLIVGGTAGAPGRLGAGAAGQVLESNGPGVAPSYQDPIVSGPAANGAAPGGSPVLIAGWDGTDVRTLSTDASGHANVNVLGTVPVSGTFWQSVQPVSQSGTWTLQGSAANGAAVSGNPNLVAGSDGADARTISTDTAGRLNVNVNGTVPVSGTFWQATQPVSLASLPALSAGSATIGAVNQAGAWTVAVSGNASVVGTASDNTANSTSKLPVIPAVATTAAPTYTTGDQVPLSTDTGGNLRVTCANCGGGSGGTAMGDAGSFTQGTTSITPIGGEYNSSPTSLTSGQAGAVLMTATRHMDVAVADPLPAGSNTIGAVTVSGTPNVQIQSNASVNVAQVAGAAPSATNPLPVEQSDGTNVLGTSTHPVRIDPTGTTTQPVSGTVGVSSLPALPAGSNAIGSVSVSNFPATQPVSGTVTANQGTAAAIAGAWPAKITDGTSTQVVDPCQAQARSYVAINLTAGTQEIAGTASKQTYICGFSVVAAAADNVALVEGTGTVCATGTAGMIGGATAATGLNLAANGGIVLGNGGFAVAKTATAADNVCLLVSGSAQVSGVISFVQQ